MRQPIHLYSLLVKPCNIIIYIASVKLLLKTTSKDLPKQNYSIYLY